VIFHTDAVQAAVWIDVNPRELGVDLLSLSAHKMYGPKGVGMLYVREGLELQPIVHGGGQEFGRRAGTENVAGIVGLAAALERTVARRDERAERVGRLRDRFEAGLRSRAQAVRINGAEAPRLPNVSNVSFDGLDSEQLLMRFDLEGIAVSAGSACTSGALEPSHVIAALNIDPRWHRGVIRFSLGDGTTEEEIDQVLELVPRMTAKLQGGAT
jgi:cysteine desulfurase